MASITQTPVAKIINQLDEVLGPYLAKVDRDDKSFLNDKLAPFSNQIKSHILYNAFNQETSYARNLYITQTTNELFSYLPKKLGHLFFSTDEDIKKQAELCANRCWDIIHDVNYREYLQYKATLSVTHNNRIKAPHPVNGNNHSFSGETKRIDVKSSVTEKPVTENIPVNESEQEATLEFLTRYVTGFKLEMPKLNNNSVTYTGIFKRLSDNRWWLRKIRTLITKANEKSAIKFNIVNRKRQIYASNITTQNRISQKLRNDNLLSSISISNDSGQNFSLKEISDLNVSNPKIRKDELVCRARGDEDIAKELGHVGLFITITCPSKYHRAFSKTGAPNPKWGGYMPDQSQKYLTDLWALTRSEMDRQNIKAYGTRVVEPQHDGTPHWHLLLFCKPDQVDALKGIIYHYAMQEDGDEKGAVENRCDFKMIDSEKGSATGYILKYIIKNIDGDGIETDTYGNDSIMMAKRIDAWASCWKIRQFQQIGGPSVSVWRELRRLKDKIFGCSKIEEARSCADNNDWKGYIVAMGGIYNPQRQQPIKLYYGLNVDLETGACKLSYYDGELIRQVKGIICQGKPIITRHHQWSLNKVA